MVRNILSLNVNFAAQWLSGFVGIFYFFLKCVFVKCKIIRGTTHFCEPCHKRQCAGDYLSKYPKDKLPKCQGEGKCGLGGKHKENGEEFSLGCSLCLNIKDNAKDF